MTEKTLRAGDTLTVPKGWRVVITSSEVTVYGPGYMAFGPCRSGKSYTFGDFIREADEESSKEKPLDRSGARG